MTVYAISNNIYLRQGDTGNIIFSGLPTDKQYSVYFSAYNPDTDAIIGETLASVFNQVTGVATLTIDEDYSNSLPVGDWVYGLKICANGSEDTLIPRTYIENGKLIREAAPKLTVDYKYVEGD